MEKSVNDIADDIDALFSYVKKLETKIRDECACELLLDPDDLTTLAKYPSHAGHCTFCKVLMGGK